MTHHTIHRAINIDNVVNVRINCPPDDLQCSDALVLVDDPWVGTCTEPLLIRRNEFLMPVIIIMYAMGEAKIGVLYPVLRAFNAGLIGIRRCYCGGLSSCDSRLQENKISVKM